MMMSLRFVVTDLWLIDWLILSYILLTFYTRVYYGCESISGVALSNWRVLHCLGLGPVDEKLSKVLGIFDLRIHLHVLLVELLRLRGR